MIRIIRLLFSLVKIFLKTLVAQFASRTMSATVGNDAVVTCQRFVSHQIENAQLVGKLPNLFFVSPHQGCVYQKLSVHCQIERSIRRFDKSIAAIGIAAVVGFRNACYQMSNILCIGYGSCKSQKKHVASRNKGIGIGIRRLFFVHHHTAVGKRIWGQVRYNGGIQHLEGHIGHRGDALGIFHLLRVPLTIRETQCMYVSKILFCPKEAGRRILSSRKKYKGVFVFIFVHRNLQFEMLSSIFQQSYTIIFNRHKREIDFPFM